MSSMSSPGSGVLARHLDDLAASTWHKVRVGPRRGLKFREDSITDHNLFELDQRHAGLSVYKFTGPEEALNGADFDWWLGSEAGGWLGMRFQAKKLDDGSYAELGHWVDGERQYDILLRESRRDQVWPLYCFYNGWDGGWISGVPNQVCPKNLEPPALAQSTRQRCVHTRLEHFGCAVAPADFVARRHQGPSRSRLEVSEYLGASIPWSHLLDGELPAHAVAGATRDPLDVVSAALHALFASGNASGPSDVRHDRLPQWIEDIRTGERGDSRYMPKPRIAVVQAIDRPAAT